MSHDPEPFALADEAAAVLADRTGVDTHDVVLVLGSGWAAAADGLGDIVADVPMDELPGFPAPTVLGHRNSALSVRVGDTRALVLGGRAHLYEGHTASTCVHGIRTAIAAGCTEIVLTNAAGGLNPDWPVGQPVLIADQLNLTGASPLAGPAPPPDRPIRFTDLTTAYSTRLRALALEVDPTLPEGVYAGLLGGAFETPAEIRMLAGLGADLVGMSTVLETIAARHLGAEVLGISLVTNAAAGLGDEDLDHEDVLDAAAEAGPRMLALLRGVLERR
ncbi:MAG: purine-nucleoside phosphorylase [Acidimicrobiaceae bacterium]|nr:purine-nucleoside phosphorylase [Acidimicrobiaceae bacterium]|tara:strand:- start:907 stop:1734 length:828 start_codon:yes stop_codon:yes gene_type:complete